jgi:O-antigen/teichoic acid export membrane protein
MSRLSKNVVHNLIGQTLLILLGLIAVRLIFRRLGSDVFGVILFTQTVNLVLVAALELGISSTTVREVSSHFREDPGYVGSFIATASCIYWIAYILLAALILLFAPALVTKWINLRSLDAATAADILRILGLSALLALPRSLYGSLFRGLQRMAFPNIVDVATSALQQGGIILILAAGGRVFPVVDWFALVYALSILAYLVGSSRVVGWRALMPRYSGGIVRRNLRFSSYMASVSLLAAIHTQADKLVVSKLLPVSALGYYSFASSTVSRATVLTSSVAQAAFPVFSELFHVGDLGGLVRQYRKVQDFISYATVPIFAGIVFAALPLFTYVFDRAVAEQLLVPLVLICIGYYMNATLNAPYVFSLAVGRPEISAKQNFLALLITVPLTFVLVHYLGLIGAGLSWVVYHLFSYAYAVPRICRECIGMPVTSWYLNTGKIMALTVTVYGVAWIVVSALGPLSTLRLGVAYAVASVAFSFAAYFMIGPELRNSVWGWWRSSRVVLNPASVRNRPTKGVLK